MKNHAGKQVLRLEGAVTIRDARKLALLLEECLASGEPVAVETAAVSDIDTCILQLLHSLRKTVADLSFDNPPEPFVNALDRSELRRAVLGQKEVQ